MFIYLFFFIDNSLLANSTSSDSELSDDELADINSFFLGIGFY